MAPVMAFITVALSCISIYYTITGRTDSWVIKGAEEDLSSFGNQLTCKLNNANQEESHPATFSHPRNAMWQEGILGVVQGQHYWQITLEELKSSGFGIAVGVLVPHMFKPFDTIGLIWLFGQLPSETDDSLDHEWTNYIEKTIPLHLVPEVKEGDVIGVYVDLDGPGAKVYFDLNGESLGLIYDIRDKELLIDNIQRYFELRPVVQFFTEGTVSITEVFGSPRSLDRTWKKPFQGLPGTWEYTWGAVNPSTTPTSKVTLELIKTSEGTYTGELSVWNKNIIYLTRETSDSNLWKVEPATTILDLGYQPDLEKDMLKFLCASNLTLGLSEDHEILSIKVEESGEKTSWKRVQPQLESPFPAPLSFVRLPSFF